MEIKNILKVKHFIISVFISLTITAIIITHLTSNKKSTNSITIGILQTISHPALDRAKDGIIQKLKIQFGEKISFIIQNAEGSMLTAQSIAKSFHCNNSICAIATIGTLATQAATQVEKDKPIFFCAVTDPKSLGIINTQTNVCGVTDTVNLEIIIKALKELIPQAKNIAIMFNPAETNSVSIVKQMDEQLKKINIESIHIGVNNESEVQSAGLIASRKADIIFVPTDNTIACVMPTLAKIALNNKKPLFICDKLLLSIGTFACAGGVDYTECGKLTASLIIKVLKKEKQPCDILAVNPKQEPIILHRQTMKKLAISIPEKLNFDIFFK